ncbi:hypothetical protein ACHAPO_010073 [Fusarium lateritium]
MARTLIAKSVVSSIANEIEDTCSPTLQLKHPRKSYGASDQSLYKASELITSNVFSNKNNAMEQAVMNSMSTNSGVDFVPGIDTNWAAF